jgi:GTPase SAR1 family protein
MSSEEIDDLNQDEEELTESEEDLFDEAGEDDDNEGVSPTYVPSSDVIRLHSGEALTPQETDEIASKARARVIMLAGAQGSGKTTLLYCLFLCFQQGPFANYSFAGSQTLTGFERRCWRARTASMGHTADTLRTEVEEYLHLTIRKKGKASPVDLIFCDFYGETFERAINSTKSCTEIVELDRIDHLVLLIDGNKLRRIDLRHAAQRDARLLLRNLIDSKALSSAIPIEIVFTKIDLFDVPPPEDEKEELIAFYASPEDTRLYLEDIKKEIKREFADRHLKLRFFETVARMNNPRYELGQGVEGLLPIWAEELPPPQPRLTVRSTRINQREIDLFLDRELHANQL